MSHYSYERPGNNIGCTGFVALVLIYAFAREAFQYLWPETFGTISLLFGAIIMSTSAGAVIIMATRANLGYRYPKFRWFAFTLLLPWYADNLKYGGGTSPETALWYSVPIDGRMNILWILGPMVVLFVIHKYTGWANWKSKEDTLTSTYFGEPAHIFSFVDFLDPLPVMATCAGLYYYFWETEPMISLFFAYGGLGYLFAYLFQNIDWPYFMLQWGLDTLPITSLIYVQLAKKQERRIEAEEGEEERSPNPDHRGSSNPPPPQGRKPIEF